MMGEDHARSVLGDDLLVAEGPELPPLLYGPVNIDGRHVDADDGAVLAGADPDPLEHRPRAGGGAAGAAGAVPRPLRRRHRRPGGQATADDRAADRDGIPGPGARAAGGVGLPPVLGDLRA